MTLKTVVVPAMPSVSDKRETAAKPSMSSECPETVPHVLRDCLDERNPAPIAIGLLHRLDAAKLAPRRELGLLIRQAATGVIVGERIEMRLHLLIEPGIDLPTHEESTDAGAQHAHHDFSSSSRDIIATVRDHRSTSTESCFLPARVIE